MKGTYGLGLPEGYVIEYPGDGCILRRPCGKAIAHFDEDATGAELVDCAWTDFVILEEQSEFQQDLFGDTEQKPAPETYHGQSVHELLDEVLSDAWGVANVVIGEVRRDLGTALLRTAAGVSVDPYETPEAVLEGAMAVAGLRPRDRAYYRHHFRRALSAQRRQLAEDIEYERGVMPEDITA